MASAGAQTVLCCYSDPSAVRNLLFGRTVAADFHTAPSARIVLDAGFHSVPFPGVDKAACYGNPGSFLALHIIYSGAEAGWCAVHPCLSIAALAVYSWLLAGSKDLSNVGLLFDYRLNLPFIVWGSKPLD